MIPRTGMPPILRPVHISPLHRIIVHIHPLTFLLNVPMFTRLMTLRFSWILAGKRVTIFVTVHGFKGSGVQGCFSLPSTPVWRSMSHELVRIRRCKPRNRPSNGRILPKRPCARFESGRCCFFCPQPGTLNREPVNAYLFLIKSSNRARRAFMGLVVFVTPLSR
jgi:hypothetical protein